MRFLFLLSIFLLPLHAQTKTLLPTKQMMRNLDVLETILVSKYAPAPWKQTSLSWTIEQAFSDAKANVVSKPYTMKDFHKLLRKLFLSMQDYHTKVLLYSTAQSTLPFIVQEVEKRVFVSWSDVDELSPGDEIISWNGEPIFSFLDNFKQQEFSPSKEKTEAACAAFYLTFRLGKLGMETPKGDVVLEVKSKTSDQSFLVHLAWEHEPDEIGSFKQTFRSLQTLPKHFVSKEDKPLNQHPFFHKHFQWVDTLWAANDETSRPGFIGEETSFVPTLGPVLLSSSPDDLVSAYLFLLPDKRKAGYIRIPHFLFEEEAFTEFKEWVRLFEAAADVLVIDQVDNPGGSLWDLYVLLSFFAKEPLVTLKNQVAITQEEVLFAIQILKIIDEIESDFEAKQVFGDSLLGYPVDQAFTLSLRSYFESLIEEWNLGHTLSRPLFLFGIEAIPPHPSVTFTKPILLLTNEKDFSCGDMFPAILQDNGRATLFGEKTAGAGGYVLIASHPNLLGINLYSYTGSLAKRLDGSCVENVGVQPDIPYSLKAEEVQDGTYSGYKAKVLEALQTLLN